MSKEEIALQLSLKVIEHTSFTSQNIKTLPYEIYNSIYNNLECYKENDNCSIPYDGTINNI
jgi:hypothetical protein|nr:MAG TPA: hypothetical protein [Caudoviricetes sp.]